MSHLYIFSVKTVTSSVFTQLRPVSGAKEENYNMVWCYYQQWSVISRKLTCNNVNVQSFTGFNPFLVHFDTQLLLRLMAKTSLSQIITYLLTPGYYSQTDFFRGIVSVKQPIGSGNHVELFLKMNLFTFTFKAQVKSLKVECHGSQASLQAKSQVCFVVNLQIMFFIFSLVSVNRLQVLPCTQHLLSMLCNNSYSGWERAPYVLICL